MDKYDVFVSYSTQNEHIAKSIIQRIEETGKSCFFAPRDIKGGNLYANEIIAAIERSKAFLLLLSADSDASEYVLREVNAAVSRRKPIIPLKLEDFKLSKAMEFYIGAVQIVEMFSGFGESHLVDILDHLEGRKEKETSPPSKFAPPQNLANEFGGPIIKTVQELMDCGYTPEYIAMRQIELDYLTVDQKRFDIIEQVEGTVEDWMDTVVECADCSAQLVANRHIMGYMDFFPIKSHNFDAMAAGAYFDKSMIEFYQFGGEFDIFVSMFSVDYRYMTQKNFALFIQWMYKLIRTWEAEGIKINRIMFSLYNDNQVKMLKLLNFVNIYTDRVKGMLCAADCETFMNSVYIKNNKEKWV